MHDLGSIMRFILQAHLLAYLLLCHGGSQWLHYIIYINNT